MYALTGRYETDADDNMGLGYWSHIFQMSPIIIPNIEKNRNI